MTRRTTALRTLLAGPGMVVAPGVFDGLSARIAVEAGFAACYLSGGAVARSSGVPDLGLLTMTEVLARVREVCDAVPVPVIADADTGYGNALNVARTVTEFERLGVAGLHLEDQVQPKRCGHYAGKRLVDTAEMVGKLHAALDARHDSDLVIVARTDALAVEGEDAALARAQRYADAGADMLFVEAPTSREQIARIAAALDVPLLINMFAGGRTPLLTAGELAGLGYKVMIVPSDLQRAAISGMRRAAAELAAHGSTAALGDAIACFDERDRLVDLAGYQRLDEKYRGPQDPPTPGRT